MPCELAPALLGPGEPEPFTVLNAEGSSPLFLTCEHASNRVPAMLGSLGLNPDALQSHFAHDLGAACLTRALSAQMDATAILAGYSRLVIDCNRPAGAPESIMTHLGDIPVSGNAGLTPEQRRQREIQFLEPFQLEIGRLLARRDAAGDRSVLVAVHSFTSELNGASRPWDVGVLQRRSPQLADALIAFFRDAGLTVGDNEPYGIGDETDYTLPVHGERAGREAVMLEIRNDILAVQPAAWAMLVAEALEHALGGFNWGGSAHRRS